MGESADGEHLAALVQENKGVLGLEGMVEHVNVEQLNCLYRAYFGR